MKEHVAGTIESDVCGLVNKIGVLIYSENGGEIDFYVDTINIETTLEPYSAINISCPKRWKAYRNRIKSELTLFSDIIEKAYKTYTRPSDIQFALLSKEKIEKANSVLQEGKALDPEIYEWLKNSCEHHLQLITIYASSNSNPNFQVLSLHPFYPITDDWIEPDTYPLPINEGSKIKVAGCRGEHEPGAFAMHFFRSSKNVQIVCKELTHAISKEKIPSQHIDFKIVKFWYQSAEDTIFAKSKRFLKPELLVKDNSLIANDFLEKKSYLKVYVDGKHEYKDITSPVSHELQGIQVLDNIDLIPFDAEAGKNIIIWATFKIPQGATPGTYKGELYIFSDEVKIGELDIELTVFPFKLEESTLDYSIYYRGKLSDSSEANIIGSEEKNLNQYKIELINMYDHGIRFPTLYDGDIYMDRALNLRKNLHFPMDKLFLLGLGTGKPKTYKEMKALHNRVRRTNSYLQRFGAKSIYYYGVEELKGKKILDQLKVWEQVQTAGGKVVTACYRDAFQHVGEILDLAIVAGQPDASIAAKWHSTGKEVYAYGCPQVGIEDPLLYRKNYGFFLWLNDYDGAMPYAYQHAFNNIWNDFDHSLFRDHVFAYPTSEGIIDTIQWEGFREGVDDIRYLTTLILTKRHSLDDLKKQLNGYLKKGYRLNEIRAWIIEEILSSGE